MSLINDALKRASQSQQEYDTVRINLKASSTATVRPQSTLGSAPVLEPQPDRNLAPAPKPPSGRGFPLSLVILLIITVAAFIWLALFGRHHASHIKTATVPPPVHAVTAPKPASPPTTRQTVAVTAPSQKPPPLKVQGITYYNGKWQAIVNGKTVYVGNTVKGFRVAAISRNRVLFVAPNGYQWKLALGE